MDEDETYKIIDTWDKIIRTNTQLLIKLSKSRKLIEGILSIDELSTINELISVDLDTAKLKLHQVKNQQITDEIREIDGK